MKILCVFFGIGRGLDIAEKSIFSNVIQPIKNLGHEVFTIYILNEVEFVSNQRSGDYGSIALVSDRVFGANKIVRVNQKSLLNVQLYKASKRYPDKHNDNYASNKNLLCQLEMLHLSTECVNYMEFDRVVCCRDDLSIQDKYIKWNHILNVSYKYPIVSIWGWHNGVAERFVVSSSSHAYMLANRVSLVEKCMKKYGGLNGEELMYFAFNHYLIDVAAVDIKTWRVRLGGRLHDEKFNIVVWRPMELLRTIIAIIRFFITKVALNK
jgi:hypothetical protein